MNTLFCAGELGTLYRKQGRHGEAEPLLSHVFEVLKRRQGEDNRVTLRFQGSLAANYLAQGRYEDAGPLLARCVELHRQILGDDHPETLITINNLAVLNREQGQYDEAEALHEEALVGIRQMLPEQHWQRGEFLSEYGRTLMVLMRLEEAEAALLEAHGILVAGLGAEHDLTQGTVNALVEIYDAWDEPDEADEWRSKLPTEAVHDGP